MADYQCTKHNIHECFESVQIELETNPVLILTTQNGNTGKWGLARLWRAWMASTAKFMTTNGVTMPLMYDKDGRPYGKRAFNANDAHELFTHQYLGVDADGARLSWAKKDHEGMRVATKGERFNAMFKHEIWATERGIILFKPRDSEYSKLEQEQNK
jgi:hypothetical protein